MKRPRYKEYWNPDLRRDQFIAGWYLSDQLAEAMIESMVKHWDKGQNDEKRGYWRLTSQKNPDKKLEDTYMNHIEQLFELYNNSKSIKQVVNDKIEGMKKQNSYLKYKSFIETKEEKA